MEIGENLSPQGEPDILQAGLILSAEFASRQGVDKEVASGDYLDGVNARLSGLDKKGLAEKSIPFQDGYFAGQLALEKGLTREQIRGFVASKSEERDEPELVIDLT